MPTELMTDERAAEIRNDYAQLARAFGIDRDRLKQELCQQIPALLDERERLTAEVAELKQTIKTMEFEAAHYGPDNQYDG